MKAVRLALICMSIAAIGAAHATRTENPAPLPNCGNGPECAEWRGSVNALNDLGGQMGGGGDVKPRPKNKQTAINACIVYQMRVQKLSRPDAQAYCAQHAVEAP